MPFKFDFKILYLRLIKYDFRIEVASWLWWFFLEMLYISGFALDRTFSLPMSITGPY